MGVFLNVLLLYVFEIFYFKTSFKSDFYLFTWLLSPDFKVLEAGTGS